MTSSNKRLASLSLDLDNQWSYMKTRGDDAWESLPSYLDLVVPRMLEFMAKRGLTITVFIVGQDAALERNHKALRTITEAGHEVGNHSFKHEPWLHLYTPDEIEAEIASAEDAIAEATGQRPVGFRGPGFSVSQTVLATLRRRGYRYDASTFPTFLGPVARAYYFFTAKLTKEEREQRKALFGSVKEGLRPLGPYRWQLDDDRLVELPVTTMPVFRLPFHVSYLTYLSGYAHGLARAYFWKSMFLCDRFGVEPSLLLHPLDFLGSDDGLEPLKFFPAMNVPVAKKLDWLGHFLDAYAKRYRVLPMLEHVKAIEARGDLKTIAPQFPGDGEPDLAAPTMS